MSDVRNSKLDDHPETKLFAEADGEHLNFLQDRRDALMVLKQANIITRLENIEDEQPSNWVVVCDLDKLTSADTKWKDVESKLKGIRSRKYGSDAGDVVDRVDMLARIFHGVRKGYKPNEEKDVIQVISSADYVRIAQGTLIDGHLPLTRTSFDEVKKPLLYIPKTAGDAFVHSQVKKSRYHIGIWNLVGSIGEKNPTLDNSPLSAREAGAMNVIFNEQFGNGYRDKNGVLKVRLKGQQSYTKISTSLFRSWGYYGKPNPMSDSGVLLSLIRSPAEFFSHKYCPNIAERKFVTTRDFKQMSDGNLENQVYARKAYEIGHKGLVYIPGTGNRYNLGTEYRAGYVVYQVDQDHAGIVHRSANGQEKLVTVFGLKPNDVEKVTARPKKSGKVTDIRRGGFSVYTAEQIASQSPEIQNLFDHFSEYQDICTQIQEAADINLTSLSLADQGKVFTLFTKLKDNPDFLKLLQTQSSNGLHTLLAANESGMRPETIIQLQNHSIATDLFQEIAQLRKILSKPSIPDGVEESILKVRPIFRTILHTLESSRSSISINEAYSALHILRTGLEKMMTSKKSIMDSDESRAILFERKAFAAFMELQQDSRAGEFLGTYSRVLEQAEVALSHFEVATQEIVGADQIAGVARTNILKQANLFLIGAKDILAKHDPNSNPTTISVFGSYTQFSDINQIQKLLEEINTDFARFTALGSTYEEMKDRGLPLIDRYVFDFRDVEYTVDSSLRAFVLEDSSYGHLSDDLISENIIRTDTLLPSSSADLPQVVIIHAQHSDSFKSFDDTAYADFFNRYESMPIDIRPLVLVYSNGFTPTAEIRSRMPGALYVSDANQLRKMLQVSQSFVHSRTTPDVSKKILESRAQAYNMTNNLREWEHITADSFQSLRTLVNMVKFRMGLYELYKDNIDAADPSIRHLIPGREPRKWLDNGTNDGRIGGIIPRIFKDAKVLGFDIAVDKLADGRKRLIQEGKVLRGESDEEGFTAEAVLRLIEQKLVSESDIDFTDESVAQRYVTQYGNFIELQQALDEIRHLWEDLFDVTLFNWHTFDEAKPDEAKKALEQQYANTAPGGMLMIEIPDISMEPYATLIREYHELHPDQPYGMYAEKKPENERQTPDDIYYPPRFFWDVPSLLAVCQSVGYIANPHDVQSYLIEVQDTQSGKKSMTVKENVLFLFKPRE